MEIEVKKRRSKYPFRTMEIGESFTAGEYSSHNMKSLGGLISYFKMKTGFVFKQRKTKDNTIAVIRMS